MLESEYHNIFQLERSYWWYSALHQLVAKVVELHFRGKKVNILDAGCGTGGLVQKLSKNHEVKGIDYSQTAISLASSLHLNCFLEDLNTFIPKPNTYDVITCIDVIYHQDIQDDMKVISNLISGLKIGGILILEVPAFSLLRGKHDDIVYGKKRYLKKDFFEVTNTHNLKNIISSYRISFLFFPVFLKRWIERHQISKPKSDLQLLSPLLNRILYSLTNIENRFILNNISFPVGTSLFMVLEKQKK